MEAGLLRERLLRHYGIRVEPEMGEYVLRHLRQAGQALRELPIIGGEARTGIPVRTMIDPTRLLSPDELMLPK